MKDATIVTLGGYVMATIIIVAMLITDGEVAAGIGAAAAAVGAGAGTVISKKVGG